MGNVENLIALSSMVRLSLLTNETNINSKEGKRQETTNHYT